MPAKLPTRALGRNGPQLPALGLGLMGLSTFYGTPGSDEERFEFLDRAYELGCTHWDSAQMYGDSEVLLGKWFKRTGKRSEIFLTTKFGNHVTPEGGREIRNDADYIRSSVKESFEKLQTDYIDLLYCHRFTGTIPVETIVTVMKEFVDAGKVKYLGLSECGVDTLQRAVKIHPIHAYQIEYSPFSMDVEKPEIGLLDCCRELGIALVAYSPLGRGILTGQYKTVDDFDEGDFRRTIPRFSTQKNFDKNLELVYTLQKIGERKGATSGQVTLAWMMKQDPLIFPIPGTKKIKYLEENIGALYVELTDEEDKEIRHAIENAEVVGTRVAEHLMDVLLVDTPPLAIKA
ncbi:short chain dehydrogenase reductase protein [Rutstroemia sp. NJR-2017a BBW]|nr:short chain dehydrogenase reductase protein [Rutstroemia sp. NJR-2017a BBW]